MKFWRSLRQGAEEAQAFAKQALLLPRDALSPVVPREVPAGEHVVVFLHGLFATAGVLRPMRLSVGRHVGLHTAALSYPPGPGANQVSERLARLLDLLPNAVFIHLVGHSMGGIVARHHAVTQGDARIVSTIALASPFGGVENLGLLGFEGARDLDADSPLLRSLRLARPARPIPHLSILAGGDFIGKSPLTHALPDGEVTVLPDRGHNAILFDREAIGLVERRVLSRRAELASAGQGSAFEGPPEWPGE